MQAFPSEWLDPLRRFHLIIVAGLFLGFAVWAWASRRRPHESLSLGSRLALIGLLATAPLAWSLTGQSLHDDDTIHPRAPKPLLHEGDGGVKYEAALSRTTAEAMDIALPRATSFDRPDTRTLNNRKILMLLPPAQMEWTIDASVRAVSIRYGFEPTAYQRGDTDGGDIFLELVDPGLKRQVFHRHLDPIRNAEDQGTQYNLVILPPLSHPTTQILRTGAGPVGNASWDWIYLSHLQYRKSKVFARQQFPGFNRLPDETKVEHTGLFQGEDGTPFLFIATPGSLTFYLQGNDHQLEMDYGFMRSAYADGGHSNGAILRIELQAPQGNAVTLFEYYAKPVEHESDRNLLHASVALPAHHAGDRLIVSLLPGDNNDASWDHTFIRELSLR